MGLEEEEEEGSLSLAQLSFTSRQISPFPKQMKGWLVARPREKFARLSISGLKQF